MTAKTNRLIDEKSPYLLQHAHNPVEWYPWGEAAFAAARREEKPVFLSVGYSTCHWCHVMARESFEDAEIAALLNRWFISIKVDREERPDVDRLYMNAVQALTGSGGWPMSVFLTPEGTPFYGGTYFPPRAKFGRPGFAELLQSIHRAWQERRHEVTDTGDRLLDHLRQAAVAGTSGAAIAPEVPERGYRQLAADFDARYGGFGGAPKFPRPVLFDFLLRYWRRTGEPRAREMTLTTLRTMAGGGMYDHLGGGFHRYSVDEQWRVPHFEKMLYDQAQLAHAYLDGFQAGRDPFFGRLAREIFAYVLRDLTDPAGGFYSAEDADSSDPENPAEHREGAFYLWRAGEITRILGQEDGGLFALCYGIEPGGNALADPQDEFSGRNIPYRAKSDAAAASLSGKKPEEVAAVLERARQKLLAVRTARPRPHLDDKVIVAWNGLMIGALARGGAILAEETYTRAAIRAATFIREQLYDRKTRTLRRRWRQGEAAMAAQLDDYAFLIRGLLDLYRAVQEPGWLLWAEDLTRTQIALFRDEAGGFFDSAPDPLVPLRTKADHDGAEPSGNSVAALNFLDLAVLLDRREYRDLAAATMAAFGDILGRYPTAMAGMLAALEQQLAPARQVVIAGPPEAEETRALLRTVHESYQPGLAILLADHGPNQEMLAGNLEFMRNVATQEKPTAHLCENFTCQIPATEVEELRKMLTP